MHTLRLKSYFLEKKLWCCLFDSVQKTTFGIIGAGFNRLVIFPVSAFSALTLLVEQQEEHPACKN